MTVTTSGGAAPLDWSGSVTLGGAAQQVRVLGADRGLPVLLVLHGGPGMPNGRAFLRRHPGLASRFTLVTWDQRGSGGSFFGAGCARLTLEGLVRDAGELVEMVGSHLPGSPVHVLGLSWGSELGVRLVQDHPSGIAGFVGSGQAVAGHEGERRSFAWARAQALGVARDVEAPVEERLLAQRHVEALDMIGPPEQAQYRPVLLGLALQRRILDHYVARLLASLPGSTSPDQESGDGMPVIPDLAVVPGGAGDTGGAGVSIGFGGPERPGRAATPTECPGHGGVPALAETPAERIGRPLGTVRSLAQLWPTATHYDFRTDAAHLDVPVAFLQGRHDHTTPSSLVREYAELLDAPAVDLTWFDHSAHSPSATQTTDFERRLVAVTATQGRTAATTRSGRTPR